MAAAMQAILPKSSTRRDAVRLGLQSAVAAATAWLLISTLLPPHASWAVISAIFVVGQSAGGTLQAALGRTVGTIVGTIIGVACVWIVGGAGSTALRIGLAAGIASVMTTFRPNWRFGIVAAVIVALEQESAVLEGALDRALAVLAGAAAGVAASFVVLRESATSRTERAVSNALAGCRDLLEGELDTVAGKSEDFQPAHQRVVDNLRRAREEASGASSGEARKQLHERLDAVQRLWHALIMIDRATKQDWSIERIDTHALQQAIGRVKDAAAARLADLERVGEPASAIDDGELRQAVVAASREASPSSVSAELDREKIALGGIAFALVEVERNICELESLLKPTEQSAGAGSAT